MSEVKRIYAHPDSTDVVLPGEATYGDPGVLQNYMELVPAADYDEMFELAARYRDLHRDVKGKLLKAGSELVHELSRKTCQCAYIGEGDVLKCGRCHAIDYWRATVKEINGEER